jgi:hypothetical protein
MIMATTRHIGMREATSMVMTMTTTTMVVEVVAASITITPTAMAAVVAGMPGGVGKAGLVAADMGGVVVGQLLQARTHREPTERH